VIWVNLTVVGIAIGAIYALAGMGLVLTYKATGIFNFAYGGIAMLDAYLYWQLRSQWGVPLLVAAPVALLVAGPGMGVLLERVVFRPLERKGASESEKLVATLGVFVLCLGLAFTIWTGSVRQGATIVSSNAITLTKGVVLGFDQLFVILFTGAVCVALWLLFRNTHLGTEIRAVVDRRELAELAAVNANRVATFSWALGCGLAGATGVLLASGRPLDPYHFTLLVIEVFSVAVVARLVSLPLAVATGVLLLGVGQSLLSRVDLTRIPFTSIHLSKGLAEATSSLKPNLSAVILLVALLSYRRLGEGGGEGPSRSLVTGRLGAARRGGRQRVGAPAVVVAVALAAVCIPFVVNDITLPYAQITVALAVIFTSIVCITGYSGQITLFQAVVAGFGAFVSARLADSLHIPVLISIPLGGLAAMGLGVLAGFPALKRRGLFLGLTTLALGLIVYSFVFENETFAGGAQGIVARRPSLFGLSFDGPWAFYWFELVVAGLMLLLARNLSRGRLGRILAAMRDSDTAARSIGIDLRAYKLFIFGASSFIAGVGGCLLAEQSHVFNSVTSYDVFTSLLWFVAVIVAGVGSIGGAVLGAVVFELLGQVIHVPGLSRLIIAVGALFIGYLPGGSLVGGLQRAAEGIRRPRRLMARFEAERRALEARPTTAGGRVAAGGRQDRPSVEARPAVVPSAFARRLVGGTRR
jgi:branched-chain amino acid transport system permease protein